ncbi:MAG: hypothetical protein Q9168_004683 [Polycauliona sp. 1 TL-2023]
MASSQVAEAEVLTDYFTPIPPEMKSMIFEKVEKKDLKKLRRMSKHMAKVAAELLFKTLTIRLDHIFRKMTQLRRFDFLQNVISLWIMAVQYRQYTFDTFSYNLVHGQSRYVSKPKYYYRKKAHGVYDQLRLSHERSFTNPTQTMAFHSLLNYTRGLQSIHLTDGVYRMKPEGNRSWLRDCTMGPTFDHSRLTIRPVSGLPHLGATYTSYVLDKLEQFGSPITQISVSSTETPGGIVGHSKIGHQTPFSVHFLHNLTRLHLELQTDHSMQAVPQYCVLALAINLEHLFLAMTPDKPAAYLEMILGGCEYKRLKSCILANFGSTIEGLFEFLRHSDELKELCLHTFNLSTGTYAYALEVLKELLPKLNDVYFEDLYGMLGPEHHGEPLGQHYDYTYSHYQYNYGHRQVLRDNAYNDDAALMESFFLRDESNPFGKSGDELQAARISCRGQRTAKGVSHRCLKYHGVSYNPEPSIFDPASHWHRR